MMGTQEKVKKVLGILGSVAEVKDAGYAGVRGRVLYATRTTPGVSMTAKFWVKSGPEHELFYTLVFSVEFLAGASTGEILAAAQTLADLQKDCPQFDPGETDEVFRILSHLFGSK